MTTRRSTRFPRPLLQGGVGTLLAGALLTPALASDEAAGTFDPLWSFGNVSVNYLDWSSGTERRTAGNAAKSDFTYVEIEGAVGFHWGEFYGFFDFENPTNDQFDESSGGQDNFRTAGKVTSHLYLGDTPFSLYAHVYDFRDYGFDGREQDQILGLGYRTTFDNGLWFKPFIGPARVQSDGYTGMNGYMAGWVAGFDFDAFDQNFSVTNWHEQTFDRDRDYLEQNYVNGTAGSTGTNGAVGLWWHPMALITTGVQYRYSNNKLGAPDVYQNAMIYSIKLNVL
ncbi:outer membrane protein OmpK [Vreelandella malpeensis]|uniref:Ion channel protein Tsx n=1 Tax=Vreelandella malpeensis TaxID=1172368 RepID=A0ABS8DN93_9GAMM|nr:outer membrane protein OmpK [Halomonas malpeensis]MCB8887777.1 ion channel protein Tsx [Halomonas malpeensis]